VKVEKKSYTATKPVTHCFMEAKQWVLMTYITKIRGLAGKEARRGYSLSDLSYNITEGKKG